MIFTEKLSQINHLKKTLIIFLHFLMLPAKPYIQSHAARKTLWVWNSCTKDAMEIVKTAWIFRLSQVFREFSGLRNSQNCRIVPEIEFWSLPETDLFRVVQLTRKWVFFKILMRPFFNKTSFMTTAGIFFHLICSTLEKIFQDDYIRMYS